MGSIMNFDSKIPIYLQLHNHFQKLILSGELAPGMPIPSFRKIASEAQVNTNTVQRAMISLVHEGLVGKETGKGYSVIKDQEKIMYRRQELVQYTTKQFLHAMKALGYDRQQIIEVVFQYSNDNSDYGFENRIPTKGKLAER